MDNNNTDIEKIFREAFSDFKPQYQPGDWELFEDKLLEDIVREKFQDYQHPYDESTWFLISQSLNFQRYSKYVASILLVLLTLGATTWYVSKDKNTDSPGQSNNVLINQASNSDQINKKSTKNTLAENLPSDFSERLQLSDFDARNPLSSNIKKNDSKLSSALVNKFLSNGTFLNTSEQSIETKFQDFSKNLQQLQFRNSFVKAENKLIDNTIISDNVIDNQFFLSTNDQQVIAEIKAIAENSLSNQMLEISEYEKIIIVDSIFHYKMPSNDESIENPLLDGKKLKPIPVSSMHYNTKKFYELYISPQLSSRGPIGSEIIPGASAGFNFQYEAFPWLTLESGLAVNGQAFTNNDKIEIIGIDTISSSFTEGNNNTTILSWYAQIPLNAEVALYKSSKWQLYGISGVTCNFHMFSKYKFQNAEVIGTNIFQGYNTLNDFEKRKPFQMAGYSGKENLYVNVNLGVGYRQMMQDKAWWYVEPTIQLPTQSHGGARKTTMGVNLGIRKWF